MKIFYSAFALLTMGVLSAGPSLAAPVGSTAHRHATESLLATPVAAYDCRRDDRGWHYMRGEQRVTCRPARPEGGARVWGWKCEGPRCGWWHQHERRWHDRG
jgi:hypothetical protein